MTIIAYYILYEWLEFEVTDGGKTSEYLNNITGHGCDKWHGELPSRHYKIVT